QGKPQAPPKYRDPESGKTWSGKGKRPPWLVEALGDGRQLEEFQIA
ncbi:MAG: H-NS family nucleoid-associated regulatory protein, partial [Hyphomicrobium sp.]